jgi:hypothetical protein
MALDAASARADVTEAALARDRTALLAIADSLPVLIAFGYERHRARAYAHALRGARGSALAELCLGVAASPPSSRTLAADAAHLHLLLGDPARAISGLRTAASEAPSRSYRGAGVALIRRRTAALGGLGTAFEAVTDRALVRVLVSTAALGAALAALVALPDIAFDDGRPDAAGITGPVRNAPAGTVVAEPPAPSSPGEGRGGRPTPASASETTLVRATFPTAGSETAGRPRPDRAQATPSASARVPSPTPSVPTASSPAPPPAQAPAPAPAPAPEPVPNLPVASSTSATTAPAVSPAAVTRRVNPNGKGLGKPPASVQVKKRVLAPAPPTQPAAPAVPASEPPADAAAPEKEKENGKEKDKEHGRGE